MLESLNLAQLVGVFVVSAAFVVAAGILRAIRPGADPRYGVRLWVLWGGPG